MVLPVATSRLLARSFLATIAGAVARRDRVGGRRAGRGPRVGARAGRSDRAHRGGRVRGHRDGGRRGPPDGRGPGVPRRLSQNLTGRPRARSAQVLLSSVPGRADTESGRRAGSARPTTRMGSESARMTALPQHFTVTATVNSAAADGTLTIAPGAIVLRLAPEARRLVGVGRVTHARLELTMLTARLLPPFSNTRLLPRGERSRRDRDAARLVAPAPARQHRARRLRAARAVGLAHHPRRAARPPTATDAVDIAIGRGPAIAGGGARIAEVRSAACGWPVRARS